MQILISARHIEVDPAWKNRVEAKLEKIFEDLTLKVSSIRVTFAFERETASCSIIVNLKDHSFGATGEAFNDMIKALDQAVDKIETQIGRLTDRYKSHRASVPARDFADV